MVRLIESIIGLTVKILGYMFLAVLELGHSDLHCVAGNVLLSFSTALLVGTTQSLIETPHHCVVRNLCSSVEGC